jgi:potassium-transporting ATPase KdpC subunit
MHAALRQLRPALLSLLVFTAITGVAYPLVVLGVGQAFFREEANGSLIEVDGTVVGSELLGQEFVSPEYFHPRPSAAGDGYDGAASSGSNLGPTNPEYLATLEKRVLAYRAANRLADEVPVPADAVTASGSGLDPHISLANARLQAPRVAAERDLSLADVLAAVDDHVDGRPLGVLGDPGVRVLALNLALDGLGP